MAEGDKQPLNESQSALNHSEEGEILQEVHKRRNIPLTLHEGFRISINQSI